MIKIYHYTLYLIFHFFDHHWIYPKSIDSSSDDKSERLDTLDVNSSSRSPTSYPPISLK